MFRSGWLKDAAEHERNLAKDDPDRAELSEPAIGKLTKPIATTRKFPFRGLLLANPLRPRLRRRSRTASLFRLNHEIVFDVEEHFGFARLLPEQIAVEAADFYAII